MPFPLPFVWSRSRTPLASRAYQQDPVLRVTAWTLTSPIVRVLTVAQHWLTVGRRRDWTLRVWYAKGIYGGRPIPSLSIRAYALGAEDEEGAEIVAEDMILARVSGVGSYVGIGTAALELSATELETNSYVDVDFRLAIPVGATTLGRFVFKLMFSCDDEPAFFGSGDYVGDGAKLEGSNPTGIVALDRSKVTVWGHVFSTAERTALGTGGIALPADTVI